MVPSVADVLDDHVDVDVGVGDRAEDLIGDARVCRDASTVILASSRLKAMPEMIGCSMFLSSSTVIRVPSPSSGEAGEHAQFDFVLAGEFDRADLQHLGAEAGHFQHLLEGDRIELLRFRHDAGSVVATRHRRRCRSGTRRPSAPRRARRRGVGTATAERRDVAFLVGALEAGDDNDIAVREVLRIFWSSMSRMRALVKVLSVSTRTCGPV